MNRYEELVAARKACRICVERSAGRLKSSAEFTCDPSVVSLWEEWLGHRRPKLLIVGQDFGNVAYFMRNNGHDAPGNKTNENLHRLLAAAGIAAGKPPHKDSETPVFLTNSILCLKEGRIDAPLRANWVDHCTDRHLRPLLDLLRPPLVVGMGSCGWRAVRRAFFLDKAPPRISQAVGYSWTAHDQTHVFAVCHCGPLGLTNRPWPQQLADWRQIGAAVATHR
jgi:uracil-DNA glycosylase